MNLVTSDKVCITENNVCYTVTRLDEYETNDSFSKRVYFIKWNKPQNAKQFELLLHLSELYVNKEILKCKYSNEVENLLLRYMPKRNTVGGAMGYSVNPALKNIGGMVQYSFYNTEKCDTYLGAE